MNNKYDVEINDLLQKLKEEIQNIEDTINNRDKINRRKKIIKNLKITGNICKVLIPFLIIPVITYEAFKLKKSSPFIREDVITNQKIIREIDSFGKVKESKQFDIVDKSSYNIVYVYGKWMKVNDNLYERSIKKYYLIIKNIFKDLPKKSNEEIIELLNDDDFLEKNLIVDSGIDMIETSNSLSEDELNQEGYIKIVIYDEDTNVISVRKQTISENLMDLSYYVIVTSLLELFFMSPLKEVLKKVMKKNEQLRDEYVPLDVDILQKKLKIKKDNYKRIVG